MLFDVATRADPVRGYNFTLSLLASSSTLASTVTNIALTSIIADPLAGFNECSGLDGSLEVESYEAGGSNGTVLKFPTRMRWEKLVLKRGIGVKTTIWDWFYGFAHGRVLRKDGVITLRNEQHHAHTVWGFKRGLPVRYQGPRLNAQDSSVAFESIEIEHEGLYLLPGASGLSSAISSAASAVAGLF